MGDLRGDLKIFYTEKGGGGLKCFQSQVRRQGGCGVSKRCELGGIVSILLENPESRLNFSWETSIPILNNSSHKPTSREIYFW